jgi:hypothetical protein
MGSIESIINIRHQTDTVSLLKIYSSKASRAFLDMRRDGYVVGNL